MGMSAEGHERQCVARVYNRDPETQQPIPNDDGTFTKRRCRKFAMHGTTVCDTHGGRAPQTRKAARRRVEYGRDLALERLIEIVEDSPDNETAIRAAAQLFKMAPAIDSEDPLELLRSVVNQLEGDDDSNAP